ncbi:YcnI family protein [Marinovum sp.]|uniref:YcnI family protein n=1 Tax=Marinovum sp. TaxID=2024839 RepID=UPI002B2749D8|nr:DUF1775 domain-containing protein [Marinovum sp.]
MTHMIPAALAAALTLVPHLGLAHATLEQQQAALNSTYKGVMRIGHGCDGEATLRVTISIPEGVIAVKPMPKPGWTLETEVTPYARSYDYHGSHAEGVTRITWSGGALPDAHYDEFVFRARITDAFAAGEVIHFPTVQTCANGEEAWVNLPAKGQSGHDIEGPAPALRLIDGAHAHH